MANITITVQSVLNAAKYDSYTIDNGQTINQLKTAIYNATGVEATWYAIVYNNEIVTGTSTLAAAGIVNGSVLRISNQISRLSTLELRQKSKLDLAALDRAYVENDRSTYDITELPTQYVGNTVYDNPNTGGLTEGRPWITTTAFTFYEAIGTTTALTTTQYATGNKIYVYSSTLDVPSYQPGRVVVNDIEMYNGTNRGQTLVILNSYGDLISVNSYDTYGSAGALTSLANALNGVAKDNIAVICSYDATALNSTVRSVLTSAYGDTNSNTWSAGRVSQIFIGIKR